MTEQQSPQDAPRTPSAPTGGPARDPALGHEIERLLARQLRRIRARFLVHGAGWVLAAATSAFVAYYAIDRGLDLPSPVRIILSLGLAALLLVALRRRVLYPLQRPFAETDVALAIERSFPAFRSKLISAFQLHARRGDGADDPTTLRNMSPAMIDAVVAEAASEARSLPIERFLRPERTLRVWGAAAAGILVLGTVAITQGPALGIFAGRALGLGLEYPRLTDLHLELPEPGELKIDRSVPGLVRITAAAGGDLPVVVRAEGKVPELVTLVVEGSRYLPAELETSPLRSQPDHFRYTFRKLRDDFTFFARGGDDPRGDLVVEVRTIEPPLVGTIESSTEFPAYTRREPETRSGGAVEALIGSRVKLAVTTTSPVAEATLAFLDTGAEQAMDPVSLQDDSGAATGFETSFTVTRSDRYEIRLISPDGLANPRPGNYPIVALTDHDPVGRMLLPDGGDVNVVVPGARIPARITAEDDFGLQEIILNARVERADDGIAIPLLDIEQGTREPVLDPADRPAPTTGWTRTVLVQLTDLASVGPAATAGDTISLMVALRDNRQPPADEPVTLSQRLVYVVDEADLQRRINGHFRRIREQVESALEIQQDRAARATALIESPPTAGREGERSTELVALLVGQGRILSTTRRIHVDLMKAYDAHLFNGLEGSDSLAVPTVVERYLAVHAASAVAEPWLPEFYRSVAADQAAGLIPPMDKVLDPILQMVGRADRLANQLVEATVAELQAAQVAGSTSEIVAHLQHVRGDQDRIIEELGLLLERLDEWNEYQDVVQQVRALRDAQRDVESRTRRVRDEGTGGTGR